MTALSVTVDPAAIIDASDLVTKQDVLKKAASLAEECYGLRMATCVTALGEREKLGTTGFGGGVAIPHAKIAELEYCVGVVIRLDKAIDYNAHDDRPVDLILALFSPETGGAIHLKALAEISRLLRDETMVAKLRGADSQDAVYALLTGQRGQQAA